MDSDFDSGLPPELLEAPRAFEAWAQIAASQTVNDGRATREDRRCLDKMGRDADCLHPEAESSQRIVS